MPLVEEVDCLFSRNVKMARNHSVGNEAVFSDVVVLVVVLVVVVVASRRTLRLLEGNRLAVLRAWYP